MSKNNLGTDNDDKRASGSRSLVPPEAKLAGIDSVQKQPHVASPLDHELAHPVAELSTPKKLKGAADNVPLSSGLEPIDLNIVNLESMSDVRLGDRAQSSPTFEDFGKDIVKEHRKIASTSNLPNKPQDPEDRMSNGRQYTLDLGASDRDHVIIEIEQARARKENERKFKIILGLVIFGIIFTVTFFMMAWEMGYLNQGNSFSTPVFY